MWLGCTRRCPQCECLKCKTAGLTALDCFDKCLDQLRATELFTGLPHEIVRSRVTRVKRKKIRKGCKKCACKIEVTHCSQFQCPTNYILKRKADTIPGTLQARQLPQLDPDVR